MFCVAGIDVYDLVQTVKHSLEVEPSCFVVGHRDVGKLVTIDNH